MHRSTRSARVLAAALTAGALLVTTGCSDDGEATAAATASPPPRLTEAGAKAALITEGDIEDAWTKVDDAATWRDQLLHGKVDVAGFLTRKGDAADCQRLLDGLYNNNLLGKPAGASALTGFEEDDTRLVYQVGDYGQANLKASMAWLETIPQKCGQFTMTGSDGGKRAVQVIEIQLPNAGDARQGMTVTMQGTPGGGPATLSMDVAVVRVGASGIALTNGGVGGADHDTTETAVELGTGRLQDVLAGKTPSPEPPVLE
ncbi:hypothetical protein [Streptomyces sp. NPDC046805]|uniref:hypothetical protein n=1 Tax=Streptomyces sp. NPDC046805 TaxID=3155134 RepID=UPI0033EA05DE